MAECEMCGDGADSQRDGSGLSEEVLPAHADTESLQKPRH